MTVLLMHKTEEGVNVRMDVMDNDLEYRQSLMILFVFQGRNKKFIQGISSCIFTDASRFKGSPM